MGAQTLTKPVVDAVATASAFGGFAGAWAPGSYAEIFGSNHAGTTRGWQTSDFNGAAAPTSLDAVSVTVNEMAAFISYVSPKQLNIQVPDGVAAGAAVPVVVTYQAQSSAPVSLTVNAQQPGLLAPAAFRVNGTQYVSALHGSDNSFVSGGDILGVGTVPAVAEGRCCSTVPALGQ